MRDVFADTSFYVALVNVRDALHEKATEFARGIHPMRRRGGSGVNLNRERQRPVGSRGRIVDNKTDIEAVT